MQQIFNDVAGYDTNKWGNRVKRKLLKSLSNFRTSAAGREQHIFFLHVQLVLDLNYSIILNTEVNMYAVVRHYHFKKEDGEKIDKLVQEGFVPLIKKAKGFIRYYWLDTGEGEGASFGVFADRAGADESIQLAAKVC